MVFNKGQDEVFLLLIVYQVIVSFIIPDHGFNIINEKGYCSLLTKMWASEDTMVTNTIVYSSRRSLREQGP